MVSYGPWQQDPDQNQFSLLNEASGNDPIDGQPLWGFGPSAAQHESGWQDDPPYPITSDDLEDATLEATPTGPAGTGTALFYTVWGVAYTWHYDVTVVPPQSNAHWEAESVKRWFRITPQTYLYNPVSEGFWDPEAIGIDYEGQPYNSASPWASGPAEIVSRGLSTTYTRVQGRWHDDAIDPGDLLVPDSATKVMLRPAGSADDVVLDTLDPPAAATGGVNPEVANRGLDDAIDLTPHIAGAGWAGTVWTEPETRFVPPTRDPGPYSQGTVRYGWGFDQLRIDTWVRPPQWRWVYAEDVVSYRRIYPRDDALGAGSNRNWPPSKAAQSSSRTSGGYL
jgi:hypothetical protein